MCDVALQERRPLKGNPYLNGFTRVFAWEPIMHTSDLVLDLASAVLSAVLAILPESFFAGSLALYFLPAMAVSFPAAHLIAGWCVDRLDGDSETHPWDRD